MPKAFKCLLTEKFCEGEGKSHVDVDLGKDVVLRVSPMKRINKTSVISDVIGPDAEAQIRKALLTLAAK